MDIWKGEGEGEGRRHRSPCPYEQISKMKGKQTNKRHQLRFWMGVRALGVHTMTDIVTNAPS